MAEALAASGGSISNAVVEVFPALGSESSNSASTSKTPPHSPHIAIMMQKRKNYSDKVEFDIAFSKVHWTVVDNEEESDDDDEGEDEEEKPDEALLKANKEAFENLKSHPHWGPFFSRSFADITLVDSSTLSGRVGKKVAEGGQAKIYECLDARYLVLKVFKGAFRIQDLQQQWPQSVFDPLKPGPSDMLLLGTVLDNGRFAFVLRKYWGDLRHLMDLKMLENQNSGPPFRFPEMWSLMRTIVHQMLVLHRRGVCHNDLKAANILVTAYSASSSQYDGCRLADYECSIGVLGTTFWRAPEILLAERKYVSARRNQEEPPPIPFYKASDVYSFGMLVYEICTGLMPFEREGFYDEPSDENYERVIRGARPEVPDDMRAGLKDLLTKCWHGDAKQRPTFEEIEVLIGRFTLYTSRHHQSQEVW